MAHKNRNVVLISLYGIENRGIRYISAILRKHHYRVSLVFLKKWVNNDIHPPTDKEIRNLMNLLKTLEPQIVGIGFGAPYFKIATSLTRKIQDCIDTLVIWGGIHATVVPEECINFTNIICVGEGEYPMLELAENFFQGNSIEGIENLWINNSGDIKKNEIRPLNEELDWLAFPDYDKQDKFYIENNRIYTDDPILNSAEFRISASRGCPFNCSYCYNSTLKNIFKDKGRYFRHRSVKNVIEELEYAREQFRDIRRIKFDDDTFIFPQNWIDEFAKEYKDRIDIPFDILLNPEIAEGGTLSKLKNAGLRRVQVGIQSGSEREAKEIYNRPASNETILKFSHLAKRLKLDVVYDVILDDPLATRKDKVELFEFLMELPRPFSLFLYSLTVFPKTEIANKLLNLGLITGNDIEGKAMKSFRQFRLSFSYPRTKEDICFISLIVLVTKSFVPKIFIRRLHNISFFYRHPYLLKMLSQFCNFIKMTNIALGMFVRGELTSLKIKEYLSFRNMLTQ